MNKTTTGSISKHLYRPFCSMSVSHELNSWAGYHQVPRDMILSRYFDRSIDNVQQTVVAGPHHSCDFFFHRAGTKVSSSSMVRTLDVTGPEVHSKLSIYQDHGYTREKTRYFSIVILCSIVFIYFSI